MLSPEIRALGSQTPVEPFMDRRRILQELDGIGDDVPFAHPQVCHLLFDIVRTFHEAQVVEVSCGYGKTTIYLAAAAQLSGGFARSVDLQEHMWNGRTAKDLLVEARLDNFCDLTFGEDARWYLLDLFRSRPGSWIDVAFMDLTHTIEVDAFVALTLWTHLQANGILILDDLDWQPSVHGSQECTFSRPSTKHVRTLFEYIRSLPMVDEAVEWEHNEVNWNLGLIRKRGPEAMSGKGVRDLLAKIGDAYQ
jgi:predicted O-methyltransferase YrrM